MFVDERIERSETHVRLIVSCVVVEKCRWDAVHPEATRVGGARRKRRLDLIANLLERAVGFGLLAYANLPLELVSAREVDGTDDIPRMTRSDNVWSQAVLAVAVAALACLRNGGIESAEIDLYYDPKSLTTAHRRAYEKTLRETLSEIAREDPVTHALQPTRMLIFRKVEEVPKRRGNMEADRLQHGTAIAHHLCSQAANLIGGRKVQRIVVRDHTDSLRSMILKFTGQNKQSNRSNQNLH